MGGADTIGGTNSIDLIVAGGGGGADTLLGLGGSDVILGGDASCVLDAGLGDDLALTGSGADSIIGGEGNDEIEAGAGADVVSSAGGADEVLAQGGDDVVNGGNGGDRIDGGLGDDVLNGGSGDDIIVPGPGRDVVSAGSGDDLVILYDLCEISPGEVLSGGGGADVLVSPTGIDQLASAGVIVSSFEQVIVTEDLAHLSECSCFHGEVASLSDENLTCACDPGWGGDRCTRCVDPLVCGQSAETAALVEAVVALQPPEVQSLKSVRLATALISQPVVRADLVVVAKPIAITEYAEVISSVNAPETSTRVTLQVSEVLKGPALALVTFSFTGPADPMDEGFDSEAPHLEIGGARLFSIRLRPGGDNYLVSEAADFKVRNDDTIELGIYRLPLDDLRSALAEVFP